MTPVRDHDSLGPLAASLLVLTVAAPWCVVVTECGGWVSPSSARGLVLGVLRAGPAHPHQTGREAARLLAR